MEINKHICFGNSKESPLLDFLQKNNIPYEDVGSFYVFDIFESSPHWPEIEKIVTDFGIFYNSDTRFTKKELAAAQWLKVRSIWHNGYPQPVGAFEYRRITYTEENYCPECGRGLRQVAPFRLSAAPKWGRRHIFSLNWVPEELFVDDIARNILEASDHTGFHFDCVHNKNGKIIYPEVHQLRIEKSAKSGIVEGERNLREVLICPYCGGKRYHCNGIGMDTYRKEAFDGMPDICWSAEYFGWGKGSDRHILINQSFYQTLIQNHLDRSLEFQPLNLI